MCKKCFLCVKIICPCLHAFPRGGVGAELLDPAPVLTLERVHEVQLPGRMVLILDGTSDIGAQVYSVISLSV